MSLCTAIALTGLYLSFLQTKKIKFLKELCDFFFCIEELGRNGQTDFSGIFENLSAMKKYRELIFIDKITENCGLGENLKENWLSQVKTFCPFYINSGIKSLLVSFSGAFGKCTRESFIAKCSDFSSRAEKLLAEEEKRYEKNRNLTVFSGVLVSAAVFFILF